MKPAPVWPTWSFTRLTPQEMAKLLKAIQEHELAEVEEAMV